MVKAVWRIRSRRAGQTSGANAFTLRKIQSIARSEYLIPVDEANKEQKAYGWLLAAEPPPAAKRDAAQVVSSNDPSHQQNPPPIALIPTLAAVRSHSSGTVTTVLVNIISVPQVLNPKNGLIWHLRAW
jgi:hypothetical protein